MVSTCSWCSNAGSQLASLGIATSAHSGLVITDRAPRRPPDQWPPPRRGARRLAASRPGLRRPGRRGPGSHPLRHGPAQHPPPERAGARRRHRRVPDDDDGDLRAAARRGLPGEPARLGHGHHAAGRSGARGRRWPRPTRDEPGIVDLAMAAPSAPSSLHGAYLAALDALPRHLAGTGYAPLGLPVLREAIARLVHRARHADDAGPGARHHRRAAGDPPAGQRARRPGRPGGRRAPDLPARHRRRPGGRCPCRAGPVRRDGARHRPARVDAAPGRHPGSST